MLDDIAYMNINPKKCFRNVAVVGGGVVVVDALMPNPGSWELMIQGVLVFVCGLFGLLRGGGH
jgi:hypothetical protein